MENNFGTVRVFDIVLENNATAPEYIDLDYVDLAGDVSNEIRERLEVEEEIGDVISFNWNIVEPGSEEREKVEKIKAVLRRYFDTTDDGEVSPDFDEDFTAQDAIDEIHDIVGDI